MDSTWPWRLRVGRLPPYVRRAAWALVVALWAGAVLGGFGLLTDYDVQPAGRRTAPQRWPAASEVPRSAEHHTLLIFLHPRCPCSRASMAELARIMERRAGALSAHVLFIKPTGVSKDWTNTSLWRSAEQIPGVNALVDDLGREADLFAADTSGQTLLYDAAGQLVFQGGITASRGHYGANPASNQVISLLDGETTQPGETPVYGCPLQICPRPRGEINS
jgi:hypothetical protein